MLAFKRVVIVQRP